MASKGARRARVALVVHDFDHRFGQGRYVVELVRRLADAFELHVFANTFVDVAGSWHRHKVPALRRTAVSTIVTFLQAAELMVRAGRFPLVHAQGLTCWRADVITAHICNAARAQHAPATRRLEVLSRKVVLPLERGFYRTSGARHIVSVSKILQGEIASNYGWHGPSSVIYHGTDTEEFRPAASSDERGATRARYGLSADAWVWLFVGEASKGLQEALAALAKVPTATLLVVTRSDVAASRGAARALGVEHRVVFHGVENEMRLAYRAADVFVYPSRYDTFALVVAEAMASELPVVVSTQVGAAEWIDEGKNGFLVHPDDVALLVQRLTSIEADRELARALGAAARSTVAEHTWDECASATAGVYESVLRSKCAA